MRMRKIKQIVIILLVLVITFGLSGGVKASSNLKVRSSAATGNGLSEAPEVGSQRGSSLQRSASFSTADISTSEWPMVQRDPQHSGYYPANLGSSFGVTWRKAFQPEKIYPQVQAIISNGLVFIGTEMGNLYALNSITGVQAWKFPAGGPILNSVACGGGRVFFGAMDGSVYALEANTGALAWKKQVSEFQGISTAPLYVDGKVLLGGRNGTFYALNPTNGNIVWSNSIGAPILQTAAWNNGNVYFGAMDMRVYALSSSDGKLAWRSDRLPGMALKDYWPLVYNGMVYVRPMGFGNIGLPVENYNRVTDASLQNAVLADYASNPQHYSPTLIRLNESNGTLGSAVIHYNFQTMNGATSPPCVDRDGLLIVPAWSPVNQYSTGWARLNVSSRIIVDALTDGSSGYGSPDETMNVTCSTNQILAMHIEEGNANYTGSFNLDSRQWTAISTGASNLQMANNTQGGGGNPASIANGWVYHITYNEVVARNTQP